MKDTPADQPGCGADLAGRAGTGWAGAATAARRGDPLGHDGGGGGYITVTGPAATAGAARWCRCRPLDDSFDHLLAPQRAADALVDRALSDG
jgi:hypothetical protein